MEVRLLQLIGEKLTNYLEVRLLMEISKWRLAKAINRRVRAGLPHSNIPIGIHGQGYWTPSVGRPSP